jgi:hypothetical protein
MYYCPSCGNEITVELKYCNRCGANLTLPMASAPMPVAPVRLTVPSIVLGLMVIAGLGIIFGAATDLVRNGMHPAAIVWIVLFSAAMLFGCTGLMIRFFTKMLTMQRGMPPAPPARPAMSDRQQRRAWSRCRALPRIQRGPLLRFTENHPIVEHANLIRKI